jgi:hypothetical protein
MHLALAIKIGICVLALYAIYILSAIPAAYMEFKGRPREKMEWCNKHGLIRRQHALPFMSTTICPRCYMEAWNQADKGKLGQK